MYASIYTLNMYIGNYQKYSNRTFKRLKKHCKINTLNWTANELNWTELRSIVIKTLLWIEWKIDREEMQKMNEQVFELL